MGDNSIIRRTSFIVTDADATADFYEQIFGWSRFYDNETPVGQYFPPCAPDQTPAKIIIMKADDPYIGMIGFMEYVGFAPDVRVSASRTSLGVGDAILVVETKDIKAVHAKAEASPARIVTAPVEWTVTDYSGDGVIHLATFSFFDPNGIYVEVNSRL